MSKHHHKWRIWYNQPRLDAGRQHEQAQIAGKDFVSLLEALGFRLARVNGSHHIFQHSKVREPVNIQEVHGQVKPYQIRQVVELIEVYGLTLQFEDEAEEEK